MTVELRLVALEAQIASLKARFGESVITPPKPLPRDPDLDLADRIIEAVAHYNGIPLAEFCGADRVNWIAEARFIAMWLIHLHLGWTSDRIGKRFKRDRGGVTHGIHRIEDTLARRKALRTQVETIQRELNLIKPDQS